MGALVFKIMPPSATFHGVDYNERKQRQGVANLLHFQNFGHLQFGRAAITKEEFKQYLKDYSGMNSRIRNAQFHAILSCKGQQFTHEQLKGYALTIMEKLGYGNNPMLIYAHNDTKHNHIHIVTSRVAPDGTKINHRFEGKRANTILNELLGLNTKQEFQAALNNALQYRVSTLSQFNLLIEKAGYTMQSGNGAFSYFKHGTLQGMEPAGNIEEKIRHNLNRPSHIAQIKAIVQQHKSAFSNILHHTNFMAPEAKPEFASELTDFLQERFGLEFIFFTGKDKTTPYGYAVIDHTNKEVHKGSNIMKMQEMLAMATSSQRDRQVNLFITIGVHSDNMAPHDILVTDDSTGKQGQNFDHADYPPQIEEIVDAMETFIEKEIGAVEKDLKNEDRMRKRRKSRAL